MKIFKILFLLSFVVTLSSAQMIKRTDAIWARTVTQGAITLDGKLSEPAWSVAESVLVVFGQSAGMPGSGWKSESGVTASDSTKATLKFLVRGDSLYMAVIARDSSVGGGLFNKFDGLLMNMRNHASPDRPAPVFEYFYGWVTEPWGCGPSGGDVGAEPCFMGGASTDRTVWNAKTTVQGIANKDTGAGGIVTPDTGYVMELCFNLIPRGYNVKRPQGDIIEFNISIYDADWQWPFNAAKFSGNRVWWQGPWGNANAYNVVRIYAKPDVTVNTDPIPVIGPEIVVKNGVNYTAPIIDGYLSEEVWKYAPSLDIRYGDDALRELYPSIGPYRSGQFQPALGGIKAQVLDPADATVKYFFRGDTLYFGADVRDLAVWAINNFDQWDGIRFSINDRGAIDVLDKIQLPRELTIRFDSTGKIIAEGYLPYLMDTLMGAWAELKMKGGTTINNYNDEDSGYTIELAIDLTKLGYPSGLGDRILFFGITLFDGDSFASATDNYGTRTWFFREHGGAAGPVWAYMDPLALITKVDDEPRNRFPTTFTLLGNYPNPFNPSTTIQFTIPEAGDVLLKVYDVLGRNVITQTLGYRTTGTHLVQFNPEGLSSGVYLYRLQMNNSQSGKTLLTQFSKMLLLK